MTQGEPLGMIVYGIGILPLIKNLKGEITDVTQTWYADDAGAVGTFAIIETYFICWHTRARNGVITLIQPRAY